MIRIEEFTQEDIPTMLKWLEGTDERFLYQFAGPRYHFPLTEEQLVQTISSSDYLPFKVVDVESNVIVGHCQFMRINHETSSASIGRLLINPVSRGRGYGSQMIQEMINYAKSELKVKDLLLRVFDFNTSAIKCYEKMGFIKQETEIVEVKKFDEEWKCISMKLTM